VIEADVVRAGGGRDSSLEEDRSEIEEFLMRAIAMDSVSCRFICPSKGLSP